jgi:hypothetical protein
MANSPRFMIAARAGCRRAGGYRHRCRCASQPPALRALQISWRCNRFRLFREERISCCTPTRRAAASCLGTGAGDPGDGRGWARNTVNRLCIDLCRARVNALHPRQRQESYLTPIDHPSRSG